MALVGMDENPMGVVVSIPSFCCGVKKQGPGIDKLKDCVSKEKLADLEPSQKGMHNGANVFMLAPWAVKSIVSADLEDPLDLIPVILGDAKVFDEENNEEKEDYQSAMDHAAALANFLWLIDRGKVAKLEFLVRPDKELQKYAADRIKDCLGSGAEEADRIDVHPAPPIPSSGQDEILKQLAASIAIQNESTKETNVLSKMEYDRKISKEKDSKDKIGKLHSSVRHQFLMAASVDGEEKASELPKSCKDFFDQDSAALSDQELSFQLENLGAQDISFGHGTIQAILAGNLLYNAPLHPSNLSLFCFYEKIQDGSDKTN